MNLKDDSSLAIQGALWRSRGSWLVLRDVSLLKANTPPTRVDGDVVIHRENVSFLQVLP